jgi:dTDP-4-dehydrorhamnose 3,5-epimerase
MKFFEQSIPGVFVIEPEPFVDERGVFRRHFAQEEFDQHGITSVVKHCNVSENKFKHTLRGFHHQLAPYGEGKTLSCPKGSIYDVVVDLRPSSSTYLKWLAVELNDKNRKSLHIPPGCANAFLTLQDDCLIHYYCSEAYHADAERGIRYNDPAFDFKWPAEPLIISDKDKNHPDFQPVK